MNLFLYSHASFLLMLFSLAQVRCQSTNLSRACTNDSGCSGVNVFCDLARGVCASQICGVTSGLACSLFNTTTYCSTLANGGVCINRMTDGAQCVPTLDAGPGLFSLPSIPLLNNSTTVEQSNSQCMTGLVCNAQTNTCATDGPVGWLRYTWATQPTTIIAIGVGALLLLICCCCSGAIACGCTTLNAVFSILQGFCGCLACCCKCCCRSCDSDKHEKKPLRQPAPVVDSQPYHSSIPPPPNHHDAYSNVQVIPLNDSSSGHQQTNQSSGYAGKIVNIETEHIVVDPQPKFSSLNVAPMIHHQAYNGAPPPQMMAPSVNSTGQSYSAAQYTSQQPNSFIPALPPHMTAASVNPTGHSYNSGRYSPQQSNINYPPINGYGNPQQQQNNFVPTSGYSNQPQKYPYSSQPQPQYPYQPPQNNLNYSAQGYYQ